MDYFWRTWNLPVHKWLVLHIYLPLTELKISPIISSFMVFFISAIFHELIISVPFHTVKLWSFFGMMAQMPMCYFTKKYTTGTRIGNIIFWMSFMFGVNLFFHYLSKFLLFYFIIIKFNYFCFSKKLCLNFKANQEFESLIF
jgi:hypothetical protein